MEHLTAKGRRAFIQAVGSAGALALGARAGAGLAAPPRQLTGKLPRRGEYLIRGAYVLTMDPSLGDIANS